ncbi:hypothetical protein JCM15457_1190 [Liquorilactobacillus sucicola DSM 21376 = JCM 15457]|uniref:Uncharacterized protein n=1 Tax=Liquorilactobacillus sucicola DSM 21376 = JCM 15457 TaxID=1423806 RepID=A0A023CWN9_9LACO|nr:hypothetical protein [Liquorilactobacillus sucicola]KRN06329.1 hypothetical protein FD15_GL001531 [Liquorilactobacillus sucicola DSM 21376 = JCM 15457]GAJ26272.1 hypothetical protein JCM15457_1190 [Liquorilactobacillus sucicola DSM 21376 = JCM 15457]
MNFIIFFTIVMLFMLIGEWVSAATKAYIPSIFVTAILFVVGFWTVLPKDIVTQASFGPNFVTICVSLLLVHLGTLMNLRELVAQWKAVCIALLGVAGTLILTLLIGSLIFNWHTVVAAVPPLTGGLVAALLMTNGLKAEGITTLVALPVSMFVLHSVVGYPLTSYMLKKEGRRLVAKFRKEKIEIDENSPLTTLSNESPRILNLPKEFQTPAFILVRVAIIALISNGFALLIHNVINPNVICLIFGVIAHQLGFLESNALKQAGVFNWLMYGLLAYVFAQLNLTTPAVMGTIILQIVVLIFLGLLGMFIASWILAKPFGMSRPMAFSCSLTALFGFPADYILTTEICHSVAGNKKEEAYLLENILPKMLVGGFATVSVASVIIASVFLKLL